MERARALVPFVLLVLGGPAGCVFEPCDCPVTRDAWQRPDPGLDPGGYELPGRDPGGGTDVAIDAGRPDDGIDTDPGHDLPQGDAPDAGECAVPEPSAPFYLEVAGLSGNGEYWPDAEVSGEAVVEAMGEATGTYVPAHALHLRMSSDGSLLQILWNLGPDIRIPVSIGQSVQVYVNQRSPWWRDLAVALWDANGMPLFFAVDGAYLDGWFDCDGVVPCPTVHAAEDDCPAVEVFCGSRWEVPVYLWLDGGLSSSEAPIPLKRGGTATNFNGTRYYVHESHRYDRMDCVDLPTRWVSAAATAPHRSDAFGCGCAVTTDCARHEVCDTFAGRCVPDRCQPLAQALAGAQCPAGGLCDPYTGRCGIDPKPLQECATDLECGGPGTGWCHREMRRCEEDGLCDGRVGGVCVPDPCAVVDCMQGYDCDPLLSLCVACRADCDCAGAGAGAFCDGTECTACAPGKIAFDQANGGRWEFYELCAVGTSPGTVQNALRQVDPTIACGVSGVFARCDEGQIACHGGGLARVSDHGALDDATWGLLCELSLRDDVVRIVGGHYL